VCVLIITVCHNIYIFNHFYPYGVGPGDTVNAQSDDDGSSAISLLRPFVFFGKFYNTTYVNNNGHLTFDQPWSSNSPYRFPAHRGRDLIAPFWTDLDNRISGVISYKQYSSGSVLTQATQNINQYFPQLQFTATSVLVATWDRVPYYGENTFQAVLISDGQLSFILMNYGQIFPIISDVQAGYDTDDSSNYFSIPGSFQNNYSVFTYSSNVNVTGRWAFRVDHAHSPAPSLKHAVLLLSSIAAKIFNAEPAPFLVTPTTTHLITSSFTFKGRAPTSCLRFSFKQSSLFCGFNDCDVYI
uniref:NIDO domain-containing protein n=1 Tax=Pygocentrus nattereri TaxID=42514 RepID=A0A3B4D6M4_PYGNA